MTSFKIKYMAFNLSVRTKQSQKEMRYGYAEPDALGAEPLYKTAHKENVKAAVWRGNRHVAAISIFGKLEVNTLE